MEMIVFLFFSPFIVGFLLIAVLWSRLNETRELAAGVRDKLGWESERITELEQTIRRMARQRSWATTEPEPAVEPVAPAAPVMEAKAIILAEPLAESVIEEPGVWLAVAAGEALDAELEPSELPMHARNPIEVASRVAVDEPEIEQPQVNAEPGIGWEARIGGQWLNKGVFTLPEAGKRYAKV